MKRELPKLQSRTHTSRQAGHAGWNTIRWLGVCGLAVSLAAAVEQQTSCWTIGHPFCHRAGTPFEEKQPLNPNDGCPDIFVWNNDSVHDRCKALYSTPGPYSPPQPVQGKTQCTDLPNGLDYLGTVTRHYQVPHEKTGVCVPSGHSEVVVITFSCDKATLSGDDCSGYP